ncbi:hypothetical protein M404DRAFT_27957 [Pisolithus tinctorius Marx 270]|uniref:Proteasome activator complex subunit 4 C-terminal domain-containing protein n=1 Tax=Pisolithus tinctorius Marx 270 TaxID=870435 RepID=A0A0C3JYA8_PISTI|nr:hypothetical protein M404DRAFT_27957 [Pisolithus tinctorius Marx 270]
MTVPDISRLTLGSRKPEYALQLPEDIEDDTDRYMKKLKQYALSLPYTIEPYAKMLQMLDFILLRITQCVEAKDYEPGLVQWDSMLSYWSTLKYPIPKEKRILLTKLYFEICVTPGMSTQVIAICAEGLSNLTRSKKKLSVEDMRLPWKPFYDVLRKDLFLTRRQFEYSQLSWYMGHIADTVRRFFHPAATNEMLATFVPGINGTNLDSILTSQYYLLTFLPLTHPQTYLPMLTRLWESINSYMFDERMLEFLSTLTEMHVDPTISDPAKVESIPDDERSEGEDRPCWGRDDLSASPKWSGLYKDVGIFTEHEWNFIMCKCLASMEILLKDAGSLTTGPSADTSSSFEIGRLPKAAWRIPSLARIIVYSMAQDGISSPASSAPTPMYTPITSGVCTPQAPQDSVGDYVTGFFHRWNPTQKTYLAGSKALDSLARLVASTEHFFHPTNSGSWTSDLTAFLKYLVYEFNKRWHEEQQEDCKTPPNRRLTREMRRELVKSIRTVVLLAMFSQDSTTVSNVQSCLKSMSTMEPNLIFQPIVERAIPSLEALVETQRTLSVIKALSAIAPAIHSREIYYSGAKHLITILQPLIPGIDLNDPTKTMCTTAFLSEVSQYVMFHDVTSLENDVGDIDVPDASGITIREDSGDTNDVNELSPAEEDALLRDTTGSFAIWIASFIRRVIQLLENLPDEGANGTAGGASEGEVSGALEARRTLTWRLVVQLVDAVTGACSQICVHLSNSLFDLVLNMIFDYATTNVRSNAVRAIHQLVECVANANPEKTLAKFFPFCEASIRAEIEHGASSVRTTSSSTPLPSDATLHWSLAILRGTVYNDGKVLLKYKERFLSLLRLLRDKTFSKRGFSWSAKLLSSALITLTHTYPTENKFVNPDVWDDPDFQRKHYLHWGKLYKPEDITWHVPNEEEINFALQIFSELVEPCLEKLNQLLSAEIRDAVWRNDFCRYLCFVRQAFSGIPTLYKEYISPEVRRAMFDTSDILDEIPEMIASVDSLNSGFCLTDPTDERYQYITALKRQFGEFLHQASLALRDQWEENTVDAVQMLISSIRVYLLEYGDSRDGYYVNAEQYSSEISVARYYAGQKVWPRSVLVRRARLYHTTRLHWNSIERARGPLEDCLLDDVVEWCMWHYPTVRQSSQALLESLTSVYDGLRVRALPKLYEALQPGTEDDRMKGALWTLNIAAVGRFAISGIMKSFLEWITTDTTLLEPTLATQFIITLLGCHHNEKPSIQNCVASVADNTASRLLEPCHLVFQVENAALADANQKLNECVGQGLLEDPIVAKARAKRVERVSRIDSATNETISAVLKVASDADTHWRYAIAATRALRSLIRSDLPIARDHLQFFLEKLYDSNPSMRYYAQRAVMKALRYIKLRTYCPDPASLALTNPSTPLKVELPVNDCKAGTQEIFDAYFAGKPVTPSEHLSPQSLYFDDMLEGWLACRKTRTAYRPPHRLAPTFQWEHESKDAIACVREMALNVDFWTKVSGYYAEETQESVVVQDHISCVKSMFQLLGSEICDVMKPKVEELLADPDKNKQRAAAELLAGVLNGSKHWSLEEQERVWDWAKPLVYKTLNQTMKTENVGIWSTFLDYMFHRKDPRRVIPLVNHVMDLLGRIDLNGQSAIDSVKVLSLFRAFYTGMGWKFVPWTDTILERLWPEVYSEHDDVRAYVAELLSVCGGIKWDPRPSSPDVETFVKECRTLPLDHDIMGIRGTYHTQRVAELVENLKKWREERLPGVRAFQSTYDRVGVTVCRWLYQSLHDTEAMSAFDYILPLLPEIFRFTEISDNEELARRASVLLFRMCGVIPPRPLISPLLDAIFAAIQNSPSWKVRLKALPTLQVLYFRQLPLINEEKVVEILDVLCKCLDDDVVEVREMAGTLSPRRSVLNLRDRFVKLASKSRLPNRESLEYNPSLRQRHAAIIGICALVDSFPYTIEKWMPELLTTVMLEHAHDPIPISTTIHRCASNFRKTHQDTWHEDSRRFTEDELAALSTLLTGSSYCEC